MFAYGHKHGRMLTDAYILHTDDDIRTDFRILNTLSYQIQIYEVIIS